MRLLFTLLLVSAVFRASAQNDDYPDYRSKKELFTRLQEKDIRSDLAAFAMGGIDESTGKLPLKTIPSTGYGADFVSFGGTDIKGDDLKVTIKSVPFEPTKHKLNFYDPKHLVKIDNKGYFGDYWKVPRTVVGDVQVIFDRDTVHVPAAAMEDLANPILSQNDRGVQKTNNKVYLSADGRKVYVYLLKQESGGSYEVTWIFQDKKYLKRVVDFGFLK